MINDFDIFTVKPKSKKDITINDILKDFSENCGNHNQVLKGGLALSYYYNSCLPSARNTIDIDFHIKSTENWDHLKKVGVEDATKNSKINCKYSLGSEKLNPNGASVTIFYETPHKSGKFKIDMDYGNYCKTKNINSIQIYSPEMILADKLSVICSPKIRRRTKDLYDVYLIISNEAFSFNDLVGEIKLKLKSRELSLDLLSILDGEYLKDLDYSYYKIKLIDFPKFTEIIDKLLYFIPPVMDGVVNDYEYDSFWDYKLGTWSDELYGGTFIMKSLKGTICKETASGILGLSTFPTYPVLIYNEHIDFITSHFRFIKVTNPYIDADKISENLFITSKEKTILDMLEDGEYRIVMESLESYLEEGSKEKLLNLAEKYNVLDKLKERLSELADFYQ